MFVDYSAFTQQQYNKMIDIIATGNNQEYTIGTIKLGKICVDIIAEASYSNRGTICVDIFVGGVKSDYATTMNGEPYDYIDRLQLISEATIENFSTYEEFKNALLRVLKEYCESSGYKNDEKNLWDFINTEETFCWD